VAYKNVDCPVDPPSESEVYGTFANAIKLTVDGSEVLIDFCLYSEEAHRAQVVSRVRVSQDFLPIIHQKIGQDLNLPPDGRPVLFVLPPVEGDQ
jgi:hypothetical protein